MTPRRILIAGWLAFLLYAYPGYMKGDAADQLVDSRYGTFTDWHSPMMTEVWRVVGRVISGPPGMLFLQSVLLLVGSYVLLRRVLPDRGAAIAAVCVVIFPPIMATSAVISAEAQLASFLVAGIAALSSSRLRTRLIGLGLVAVACGMRDGASLAAIPIVVAMFWWNDHARCWQRIVIATLAWLVVTLVALGTNKLLVETKSERNDVSLAMADIVGTLAYAHDLDDAAILQLLPGVPLASATDIQRHARAVYDNVSRYATSDQRVFDPPVDQGQRDALCAGRCALARAEPAAYLAQRWHLFRRVLRFKRSGAPSALYTEFLPSPEMRESLHYAARHSLVQWWLIRPVHWLSQTFLFRPQFCLILAIVLLPLAAIRRVHDATMLLTSGVLYELALMFEANRAEYRDSHWMIVSTVIAIIVLVVRLRRSAKVGLAAAASDQ